MKTKKTLLATVPPSYRAICKVWCRNIFSLRDMTIGKSRTDLIAMTKSTRPQYRSVGSYLYICDLSPSKVRYGNGTDNNISPVPWNYYRYQLNWFYLVETYNDLRIMSLTRSAIPCRGQFMLISQQSPAVIQRRKLTQAVRLCLVFWRLSFQISTGRPAYAMFLVWLTGRVSESHVRCHGYITVWFVSDGTTGVPIVRIKVRLE